MKIEKVYPKFEQCWKEFCDAYDKAPRHKMLPKNFKDDWKRLSNEAFWTERDIVRKLSNLCEKQFGEDYLIHNETPIDKMFFDNFKKEERKRGDKRKYIDIDLLPAHYSLAKVRTLLHTIFAEVKWISARMQTRDIKRKINGIKTDCEKLRQQIVKKRCALGYVCVIIDEKERVDEIVRKIKGCGFEGLIKKWEIDPVKVLIY